MIVMQIAKAKASPFPYFVALAIIAVNLVFDAATLYRIHHMPAAVAVSAAATHMMPMVLGGQWASMVFSVTLGLGCAQWLMERRRASLPWQGAVGVAIFYGVLWAVLNYGWLAVQQGAMARAGFVGVQVLVIAGALVMKLLALAAIMLALWLAYRVSRGRTIRPAEMRWRSLLIFALFAWVWHLMIVQLALPSALAAAGVYGMDLWSMAPWMYVGSFVLALPIWLGALPAWPAAMPSARVPRAVLASFLSAIINIVAMLAASLLAVFVVPHRDLGDATAAAGAAWVAALLWFVIALPLCWLSVKALMRSAARDAAAGGDYRLGENSA